MNGTPKSERVNFGTQVVYLRPEDLDRLERPSPDPDEFLPKDPPEAISLLSLVTPLFGELVAQYGWRNVSDAEAGHRFAVAYLRERLAASGGLHPAHIHKPSDA